jgi:F0F1-type ATP synthase membrane subunit b/b'
LDNQIKEKNIVINDISNQITEFNQKINNLQDENRTLKNHLQLIQDEYIKQIAQLKTEKGKIQEELTNIITNQEEQMKEQFEENKSELIQFQQQELQMKEKDDLTSNLQSQLSELNLNFEQKKHQIQQMSHFFSETKNNGKKILTTIIIFHKNQINQKQTDCDSFS